jgi:hypothetical protein
MSVAFNVVPRFRPEKQRRAFCGLRHSFFLSFGFCGAREPLQPCSPRGGANTWADEGVSPLHQALGREAPVFPPLERIRGFSSTAVEG